MSNLPVKKEEGIFGSIKDFFKRLFGTNKKVEDTDSKSIVADKIVTLNDDLKEKVNTEKQQISSMSKDRFIAEIENNPELLNNLSEERLEKLSEYYDGVIAELKSKLNDGSDYISNMNKDSFIAEIERNPELLNNLSEERLEKLSEYYDKEIEILKKKLAS